MHRKRVISTFATLLTVFALLFPVHISAAPAAPSGLTATVAGATQVNLAWTDNSTDETGFRVERSDLATPFTPTIVSVPNLAPNATAFTDNTVVAGSTYSYRVIATGAPDSGPSNVATTTVAIPLAPSSMAAAVVGSAASWQINLTWTDNSNNEASFSIERSSDNFANITTIPVPGGANRTSYSDTTGVAATTYSYRAVSINALGPSATASNVATATFAPPTAPSALFTTIVSATQVNLGWNDNSLNETGFRIERSTDGITFATLSTVTANGIAYSDTTVTASTFFYRVIATSLTGDSAPSNLASVRATKPAAPSALAATLVQSRIDLTWTDNSDNETGFRIERSIDNFVTAPGASFIVAVNFTAYSDTTIVLPATYSYRIFAVNTAGDSTASNVASAALPAGTRLTVGPIDPSSVYQADAVTGFPAYYQDDQGTRLALLPITGDGFGTNGLPTQIFQAPNPANPYSAFLGFDMEAFYYDLTGKFDTRFGKGLALMGLEAGFATLTSTDPQQEAVFARLRFNITGITVPGTYTIDHPYGTETVVVTADDVARHKGMKYTSDVPVPTARDFYTATTGKITRFLRQTTPVPPAGWIGDGFSVGPVTGSPNGVNAVKITGPAGVNLDGAGNDFVIITQFTAAGRMVTAAMPGASFTTGISPLSGHAPVTATFTDTSTGTPTNWLWNFGDGSATSTLQNPPPHAYNTAGNYTVTLTATNANGSASASRTVSVYSAPTAAFTRTVPPGPPPAAINFTDTSTGNPTSWVWDFGDGSPFSALQNPVHSYAAGTFTAKLTVANATDTSTVSQTLSVSPNLAASFTKDVATGNAPLTVNFNDTSSGTGALTRSWNFGDATPLDTTQTPSHVYTTGGAYKVTLTVTDTLGTAATSQTVTVYSALTANFTRSAATGAPPLAVNFTDTSVGLPATWSWNFGDGSPASTLQNPTHNYTVPGTYTVTLTVTNPATPALPVKSASQTVTVSNIFIFQPTPVQVLQVGPIAPVSVWPAAPAGVPTGYPSYYQDDQGTRLALLPIAGDGLNAPTQIFQAPNPANPYSAFLGFDQEAFYYDLSGKFDTVYGKGLALIGLEAGFTTLTVTTPGAEAVFARLRFNIKGVTVPGTYTIVHPFGTETTEVTQTDIDRHRGLHYTKDVGLVQRDFLFATTGKISRFLRQVGNPTAVPPVPPPPFGWIGDGVSVGPVTAGPTGVNTVTITGPAGVDFDGPAGPLTNVIVISNFTVAGRMASSLVPGFTTSPNPVTGAAPQAVTFTDTTTGGVVTSWLWDFGDGSAVTAANTVQNPVHTYNTAGNYTVKLTVTDALASASTTRTVSIFSSPIANFTSVNGATQLTMNFADNSTGNITGWLWNFGEPVSGALNTSTLQNPTHTYAAAGTYTVSLTAYNVVGAANKSNNVNVVIPGLPAAPSALNATGISTSQAIVNWTDNSSNENSFLIERSTSAAGGFFPIGSVAANVRTYTDLAVTPGTAYFYEVFASNATGATVNLGGPLSVSIPALPPAGGGGGGGGVIIGGGGGGGGIAPPPQPVSLTGLTSTSPPNLNASGVATTTGTVTTTNGTVSLTVPAGTRLQTATGAPVTTLTATPLVTPASPPPRGALIVAYSFGPSGAQFNPPLTMTMTFTAAQVPAGTPLNKLVVAYWDGKAWIKLSTVIDPLTLTATAQIPHFTDFALIHDPEDIEPAPAPSPTPTPSTVLPAPSPSAAPTPTPKPVITEPAASQPPTPSSIVTEPPPQTKAPAAPAASASPSNTWPLIGIGMGTLICAMLIYLLVGRKTEKRS